MVNAGQEPGPRHGPVSRADISINSYESRIERTERRYVDTRGATRSFARTLQPKDTNANALRDRKNFPPREYSDRWRVVATRRLPRGEGGSRRGASRRRADKPDEEELPGKSRVLKSLRNPLRMPLGLTIPARSRHERDGTERVKARRNTRKTRAYTERKRKRERRAITAETELANSRAFFPLAAAETLPIPVRII